MMASFADVFKAIESLSKKQPEKDDSEVLHIELIPFCFYWSALIFCAIFSILL